MVIFLIDHSGINTVDYLGLFGKRGCESHKSNKLLYRYDLIQVTDFVLDNRQNIEEYTRDTKWSLTL